MKHITTILLATVAAAGLMSSAYAADLIIEEPAPVGIVDVGGNWDGAFIGGFIGAGWGLADHTAAGGGPLPIGGNDIDLSGWLLGVDAGFNATVGSGLVVGIVGDIAWSNLSGEIVGGGFDGTTHTIDWMGSLRGRLGFDGGAFLPYLTGGLAVAHAERHSESFGGIEADATHIGWTVGAGVEFAVSEELSIDLLYRYSDYGAKTYDYAPGGATDPEIALTAHTIQAGLHWNF